MDGISIAGWRNFAQTQSKQELMDMKMSYKDLAQRINAMPLDRQEDEVTVLVSGVGECYAATDFGSAMNVDQQGDLEGVLEQGHFVVKI